MPGHAYDARSISYDFSASHSNVERVPEALPELSIEKNEVRLKADNGAFAATMAACGIYLLPFMRVLLARTDEGTFLEGSARIVRGQVFGRDFMEVMGPGTFYWLAGFYKIFGANVFASRVCLYLSWLITAFAVYRLSRFVPTPYRFLPLTLILVTCFSSIGVGVSHHIDSNWLALLAVLCLDVWRQGHRVRWLVLSGMFGGFTALVHQPKGVLLMVAAGLWIWFEERKHHDVIRALYAVAAGVGVVAGIAFLYFVANGALADVIRTTCTWPLQHYSAMNEVPYAYGTFKFNWRGGSLDMPTSSGIFSLACVLIVPFLYVAVLPVLVTLQALLKRPRPLPAEVWLYLLCGFAMWASELHRKDIVHLVFGSPLLIIASVHLLSQTATRLSRIFLVVLTASCCTLAACNLMVALTARTVWTRAGRVAMFEGGDEFAALNAHLAPGEEIFAYPYCPSYYFLTQTHNPMRFSILQSGYNTPDQVAEVIRVLESRKVKHILWDTGFRERSMHLVFPAASQSQQAPDDLAPLESYVRNHYLSVYSREGFQILERRCEPNVHRTNRGGGVRPLCRILRSISARPVAGGVCGGSSALLLAKMACDPTSARGPWPTGGIDELARRRVRAR